MVIDWLLLDLVKIKLGRIYREHRTWHFIDNVVRVRDKV